MVINFSLDGRGRFVMWFPRNEQVPTWLKVEGKLLNVLGPVFFLSDSKKHIILRGEIKENILSKSRRLCYVVKIYSNYWYLLV